LSTLKDHLRDVTLFRKSGISTNYDVLRVEVQVSEAESELLNAQDNAELAKSKLAETLGTDQSVDPSGRMPELKPELVNKVALHSPEARPDLQALSQRVSGLDYQERAAGRHWVPELSAYGNYIYYNNLNDDYDDWSRFRNAYQVGLRLKWNLFDGFHSTARSHEALEQKVQNEKLLRAQQLKAKQDVSFWTRKYKYFASVYKSRQNDIGKTRESVRLAREGRRAGARTNTDLLDAESELYRSQASAITAQLGAIEALINVELATGLPVYEFESSENVK
jgi:outer membrane protein TolC